MKKAFILFSIFYFLFSSQGLAKGATLYSGSATQVVYEGQSFVVDWYLNTEGVEINTLDLKLEYTTDTLRVTDASIGNSLISLWIKTPQFDNNTGIVELTGGVPNGFNGSTVPIFRMTFEALKTGNAKVSLSSSSNVLKNDGMGSSEILKHQALEFPVLDRNLQPLQISSTSHPDQNKWYQTKDVRINFSPKSGTDYSLSFSSNAEIFPDDVIDNVNGNFEVNAMPDGTYYFKVNSKVGESSWQEAGVYRVQIDATEPENFSPIIGSDESLFGGQDFISFSTVDKTSGISHYYIKSGLLGTWKEASSPSEIKRPFVGKHIKILAVDNAGNKRVEIIEYKGYLPVWLFVVLVGLVVVLILWFFLRRDLMRILQRK